LQYALRPVAGESDGFVGGEQRDVGAFQFALDGQPFECAAGDAGDAFAVTTSNRRPGCAASASRSVIPPSRAMGMPNRS
jgi:hypothetical protein